MADARINFRINTKAPAITVTAEQVVQIMLDLGETLLEVMDADGAQVDAWNRRKHELVKAMVSRLDEAEVDIPAEKWTEPVPGRNLAEYYGGVTASVGVTGLPPWETKTELWDVLCGRYALSARITSQPEAEQHLKRLWNRNQEVFGNLAGELLGIDPWA